MIDTLIIKSEFYRKFYRKKENELKEKDSKVEYLSVAIEELNKTISLKDDEIKTLKGNIESLSKKLNKWKI